MLCDSYELIHSFIYNRKQRSDEHTYTTNNNNTMGEVQRSAAQHTFIISFFGVCVCLQSERKNCKFETK